MSYLVLVRCGVDDIPMGVFDDIAEAKNFAAIIDSEDVKRVARDVFKFDVSVFLNVSLVTFNGPVPFECQVVRDLENAASF